MTTWYYKQTSSDQGSVIDEETGRNVAITYDVNDVKLIAAAPELLEALQIVMNSIEWQGGVTYKIKDGNLEAARAAIRKAKEG